MSRVQLYQTRCPCVSLNTHHIKKCFERWLHVSRLVGIMMGHSHTFVIHMLCDSTDQCALGLNSCDIFKYKPTIPNFI
jgi:hypothetical protein